MTNYTSLYCERPGCCFSAEASEGCELDEIACQAELELKECMSCEKQICYQCQASDLCKDCDGSESGYRRSIEQDYRIAKYGR